MHRNKSQIKRIGKKFLSVFVALAFTATVLLPTGVGFTAKAADATSGSWGDSGNYDTGWYDNHSGDSPFIITTAAQLAGLAKKVNSGTNFGGKTITIGADIDLSAHFWVPIGNDSIRFAGTFNGEDAQGVKHVIKGLKIGTSGSPDSTYNYVGLFGYISYGDVKNINLSGIAIYSGSPDLGSLAGECDSSTLEDCTVSGSVTSTGCSAGCCYVGGLVGCSYCTIQGCSASCSVTSADSNSMVGGLVGVNNDPVSASCATGNVSGTGPYNYIGGLVGYNSSTVSASYATGNISGSGHYNQIGGLVGYNNNVGTISKCCSLIGTVTGTDAENSDVGGLVGNNLCTIAESYSASSSITVAYDCTASSGGVVGNNVVNSQYDVNGNDTGCYFDVGTTGRQSDSNGSAIGLSTAQMQGAVALNNMSGFSASDWAVTTVASCGADYYPIPAAFSSLTVDLDCEGDTSISAIGMPFYEMFGIVMPFPSRDGYTFGGWYTDGSFTMPVTARRLISSITLYAKWTAKNYALHFDSQGGTSETDKSVTYDTQVGALPAPARDHYTFGGWFTQPNGQGTPYTQSTSYTVSAAEGTTLYAKWVGDSYPITYNLNGGTNSSSNTAAYTYGTGLSLNNPTKDGYTFGGWFSDSAFTAKVTSISNTRVGAVTLYAKWTANSYALHFDSQGGSSQNDKSVTYDMQVGALPAPARAHYTFGGWFTQPNGQGTQYTLDTSYTVSATEGTTLYAKWVGDSYPITYNLNGGTNSSSNTAAYTYGTGLSLNNPTKDGYTFGGWFSDAAFTAKVTSINNTQNGSVTLYADWLPKTVTNASGNATFDLGNTVLPSDVTSVSAGVSTEPSSGSEAQSVAALLKQNSALGSSNNFVLYNLKLLDQSGNAIAFTGSVTVRLPVPQGMTNPHVYWFDGTSLHDMNAAVQNGVLVFTTTHFSYYTIAQVATGTSGTGTSANNGSGNSGSTHNPNTGDNSNMALPVWIAGAFAALAAGTFKKRRLHCEEN